MILTMDMISLPLRILEAADTPSLAHLGVFESGIDDTTIRDNFSLVRQAQYALKSKDVPMKDFRVLINVVDHHLQTTLGGQGLTTQGRILVTAAHTFFYLIIRELVPSHHLPRAILGRLGGHLQKGYGMLAGRPVFQPGLLWCLVIGASAAFESGQDWDFFSGSLREVLALLGVSNSLELEVMAADFLWHERFPGEFLSRYVFPPMLEAS